MRHFSSIAQVVRVGLFLALAAFFTPSAWAQASGTSGKRVALVIGNGAYREIPSLSNPANDARLVAARLQALGFVLVGNRPQLDLDKRAFDAALSMFQSIASGADVAVFYYAGHGVQIDGLNWLVPVSAAPQTAADVMLQMVNANDILASIRRSGAKVNLVVLDACRNNPFTDGQDTSGRSSRSQPALRLSSQVRTSAGLGRMEAPDNTVIAYSTQPGNVALDGNNSNSPFSQAFAESIMKPGFEIREALNDAGVRVKQLTRGSQQPWVSSSPLDQPLYLAGWPGLQASQVARPDVLWVLGTWQGSIINFPRSLEAGRSFAAALNGKELICYWQLKGTPQSRTNCDVSADGIRTSTGVGNTISLNRNGEMMSGTMHFVATSRTYRLELRRVSTSVIAWQ
jgi:hypothetical protein